MAASYKKLAAGWLLATGVICGCSTHGALLLSNASQDKPRIVYVTQFNNNQMIDLNVGDELVVYLPAVNGGKWQLLQSIAPQLINRYPVSTVGDGTSFYFIANAAGLERASFLTRPGTGYTSAGSSYDLQINVADRFAQR